jgi:uncharacterized protein (TIGR03435 family)
MRSHPRRIAILVQTLFTVFVIPSHEQTPPSPDLRFEVASIRATEATGFPNIEALRAGHSFTPGLFIDEQMSLGGLVMEAFGIKQVYEAEYPHWMDAEHFTIRATSPEGATKADLPILLQHLLEDRFGLKFHREPRHISGYELVVLKPSRGLVKATTNAPEPSTSMPTPLKLKDGVPQFDKDRSVQMCYSGGCVWHEHDRTMRQLAQDISAHYRVPVMDATALEGGYDYTLSYNDIFDVGRGVYVPAQDEDEHPMLKEALPRQLGLQLKPVKDVTVEVLVVDSANRSPSAN